MSALPRSGSMDRRMKSNRDVILRDLRPETKGQLRELRICGKSCTILGPSWTSASDPQPLTSDTMRACVQRVRRAQVVVGGDVCGRIDLGMVVLLGVAAGDTEADARQLADKIAGLRIFEDGQEKMNLSLADVGGAMLVVSQFTLLGDCRKGRRPSFVGAAPPDVAERLYQVFVDCVARQGVPVATGRFRTHMEVELVNDGPVTLWVESNGRAGDEPPSPS
jgi:D-aminoacyl-tRNA deacylase